jgi:hypothetical protein
MDVPQISDFVVWSVEEFCEVLCRFENVREPNEGWQVLLLALDNLASELDLFGILLVGCLYRKLIEC